MTVASQMSEPHSCEFGVIVIGRNEGERLKRCLLSISRSHLTIYVDSGSSDGSVQWARDHGVDTLQLDSNTAFTAGRARNMGFARLTKLAPQIRYVQFIDGDCEMHHEWPLHAIDFLRTNEQACAAFGRRRELDPHSSIYNQLCDAEWNVPIGLRNSFGGDIMIRAEAFATAGGFRNDLIAGEEPDLCVRLRAAGWKIYRIDCEMTFTRCEYCALLAMVVKDGSQWLRLCARKLPSRCSAGEALGVGKPPRLGVGRFASLDN